jgi:hypothetical protein
MNVVTLVIAALAGVLALGGTAAAQNFDVTLNRTSFTYPSADPGAVLTVSGPPLTITYRVRSNGGHPWRLTVRATGDLVSGGNSIQSSNVTWTATSPLVGGTLSTTAQTIVSGTGNVNPARTGSLTFSLRNSWTYRVGTYSQTIVFTLVTP